MNSTLESSDPFLTASEVAERLGLTRQHVSFLAREGHVPFVPTKLGRLFARADVERLAEEREERRAEALL